MAAYLFDSSAVVKRYVVETGTAWVSSIADLASGNRIYLARITFVEVISAITRKTRGSGLSTIGAPKAIALILAAIAEGLAVDDPDTHP